MSYDDWLWLSMIDHVSLWFIMIHDGAMINRDSSWIIMHLRIRRSGNLGISEAGNLGILKSGNLGMWESGILGIWKPGIQENREVQSIMPKMFAGSWLVGKHLLTSFDFMFDQLFYNFVSKEEFFPISFAKLLKGAMSCWLPWLINNLFPTSFAKLLNGFGS